MLVLGAGFGGLELATTLSEALGDAVDVTLIDKGDSFVFGYSKLDVMFGPETPDAVRLPYHDVAKPGVRFLPGDRHRDRPRRRRVDDRRGACTRPTSWSSPSARTTTSTPRRASPKAATSSTRSRGAERLREVLPDFTGGRAIVGVLRRAVQVPAGAERDGAPPARLPHRARPPRRREITLVMPFGTRSRRRRHSQALLAAFAERGIQFVPGRPVASLDPVATWPSSTTAASCRTTCSSASRSTASRGWSRAGWPTNGCMPVDPATLATRFPGVYAIGDVRRVGTPKAGVFAEAARRASSPQKSDREAARGRIARGLRRSGVLLHRVRRRPGRARRRGLPLRPEADRHVSGAVGGARRREEHFGSSRRAAGSSPDSLSRGLRGSAGRDHPGMRRRLPSATVTFLCTDVGRGLRTLLHLTEGLRRVHGIAQMRDAHTGDDCRIPEDDRCGCEMVE